MVEVNELYSCVHCRILQPQNAFCYHCVKKGLLYTVEKFTSCLTQYCSICNIYFSDQALCCICKIPTKVCLSSIALDFVNKTYKRFKPRGCNDCGKLVWNGETCCGKGTFP